MPPHADPAPIDRGRFVELRLRRPKLLAVMLRVYLEHAPALVAALTRAAATGDAIASRLAAHSLKSSSANCHAMALSSLCQRLEASAAAADANGDAAPVEALAAAIAAEFARVEVALRAELRTSLADAGAGVAGG